MATSGVGVRELPEAHTFDHVCGTCVCVSFFLLLLELIMLHYERGRNLPRRTKVRGFNRPNANRRLSEPL